MEKEKIHFIRIVANYMRNFSFSSDVADFIACQFALESNFGKSDLARHYCNYCGMKYPSHRITVANRISERNQFSQYTGLTQCMLDYVLCLQYHRPFRKEMENLELFKGFIKWYCPEVDYINNIIKLLNQYQNVKGND